MRRLRYAEPSQIRPSWLVLIESTGEVARRIWCMRSWLHVTDRDGRRFRLNGQDLQTGELVYLPVVVDEGA